VTVNTLISNLFIYLFIYLGPRERKSFIMKSLPCKWLEYTRGGAYWWQDKKSHSDNEPVAYPEQSQSERRMNAKFLKSEPRADPESEPGIRSGFARGLSCVRSVLYMYFVTHHSDSTYRYSEADIKGMFGFLVDNIYVVLGDNVFHLHVSIVIPIGINCAPLLAHLFLYERKFVQICSETCKV
jgi:hypothetical protein